MKTLSLTGLLLLAAACSTSPPRSGDLNRDEIDNAIKSKSADYYACYENETRQNKNVGGGKVLLYFHIEYDGSVSHAKVIESTLQNSNVETCSVRVIQNTKFGAHMGPVIQIKYPLTFSRKQ